MNKFSIFALAAVALASCSSDEVTDMKLGSEISFATSVLKQSRAAANNLGSIESTGFKMWGYVDDTAAAKKNNTNYFASGNDGLTVTKSEGKWTYGSTKFWPTTALSFYCLYPATPASGTVSVTATAQTITGYVANGTEDLLYATNKQETKANHESSPIDVNFRHALSKIVFKAKNTNPTAINVTVKGVSIQNVLSKGDFKWANATTDTLFASAGADAKGKWTKQSTNKDYTVFTGASKEIGETAELMTTTVEASQLFLLPQTLTVWDKTNAASAAGQNGAYILVDCLITDATSGIQIWPATTGTTSKVAIPFTAATWEAGYTYTYILNFGQGAGYNPTDNKPVLVAIDLNVTGVDEFTNGNGEGSDVNPL